ncbi:MAG: hypothetical protein BMS9Abin18_1459 [Zetaproteobacteria bacterium]|nr:MAG: hypothetical protein BMS9Abin18_1459 [Zetaproteobacteria bacterium]
MSKEEILKALNVLIVDDEAVIQNVLVLFFERYAQDNHFSVNVSCISDPVKALFELSTREEQFDVVTLDVQMPKLVGNDIFESLMHVSPDLVNRIVFVTGYGEDLLKQFPKMDLKILLKSFSYPTFCKMIDAVLKERVEMPGNHDT